MPPTITPEQLEAIELLVLWVYVGKFALSFLVLCAIGSAAIYIEAEEYLMAKYDGSLSERLSGFAEALDCAPRLGADRDVPEGARVIHLSDTLAVGLRYLLLDASQRLRREHREVLL